MYYAFTTLSTVGFGDFYPISNVERAYGSILLFAGTILFSYIMQIQTEIIKKYVALDEEFEESDQLDKFFAYLQYFNNGAEVKRGFKLQVTEFFNNKWSNDKNNITESEED